MVAYFRLGSVGQTERDKKQNKRREKWQKKALLLACSALLLTGGCNTFREDTTANGQRQPHSSYNSQTTEVAIFPRKGFASAQTPSTGEQPSETPPISTSQLPSQLPDSQFELLHTDNPKTLSQLQSEISPETVAYDLADEGDYEPIDFLGICEGVKAGFGYNGEAALRALLKEVKTEDCELAQTRLSEITDLRLSGPEMPEAVITCLLIDLPTYVDIGTIAAALPNLTRLELNDHIIEDLTPIRDLTHLSELHLANTELTDISPIASLTQLTTLNIGYNQVQDISAIGNLHNLRSLNLAANPIRDISPLAALPHENISINLSDVHFDQTTCPDTLGDICESPLVGYLEGLRNH